jgi:type IV pilus assembly protein PilQ
VLCADVHSQQPAPPAAAGEPVVKTEVTITDAGTFELHVQGTDIRKVLQLLSTRSETNIIATKDVSGTVTADLYGVTFDEALEAVLKSAGFEYIRKGNFVYVMTPKEKAEREAAMRTMTVKVFKLNYITAADAKTLITPVLSQKGVVSTSPDAAVGIATSNSDAGGNTMATEDVIVVKDYPEEIEKVTEIIKKLDVRPQQVLIEATILRATLNENNALGIDFNALAGVDFQDLNSTSTAYQNLTIGDVPNAQLSEAGAGFRTDFRGRVPPGGLSIGFIFNEIALFIRALESVTDVAVLANPKLLVMNKQRGEVMVGNRDGYLTTVITETAATQTVEFIETGTRLVVRPYIATDGYVRLEIHPEDSTGGVSADQLPFEQTTECTSNVLVKDGHTIVIGGLFRERTSNNRSQVPLVGNIPVLGHLFSGRVEATTREEVIILITPHIIKHAADEIVSEQLKDQVWRIRLGMRQGLMWFGRSRLAQAHMHWARQHMARGRERRALWDVKLALSLVPRLDEALTLRERLTNQAIWSSEPRVSSSAYIIQRMVMQELGLPAEKVLPPFKPRDAGLLDEEVRDALGIGTSRELPLTADPRDPVSVHGGPKGKPAEAKPEGTEK